MMAALMKAMDVKGVPNGEAPRTNRRSIDHDGEQFAVGDSDEDDDVR
jgi:hypothetical protein